MSKNLTVPNIHQGYLTRTSMVTDNIDALVNAINYRRIE
jgi:hypothetical protein